MKKALKNIRCVISEVAKKHNVKIEKIILFGSRARGEHKKDSDWDLLIVTSEKLDPDSKVNFWYDIYRRLNLPADIIIVSKETLEKFKESKGFIYSYALTEGVSI